MRRLEGKVAVVTGASRGIGKAIALRLAHEGASLAVIATRIENTEAVVSEIESAGGIAKGYGLNVGDFEATQFVFGQISDDLGVVTVLVNNAGITKDNLFMRMSEDEWDQVLDINLKGCFNCSKAVIKGMMKARWGRIINLSSIVGLHGAPGQVNYSASKAGIVGMSMSMAKELGARGITCNVIAPGFIETDMTHELPEEMKDHVKKSAPLGRLGSGEDIASVVAFLACDDSSYMTGQVLTVDGGLSL